MYKNLLCSWHVRKLENKLFILLCLSPNKKWASTEQRSRDSVLDPLAVQPTIKKKLKGFSNSVTVVSTNLLMKIGTDLNLVVNDSQNITRSQRHYESCSIT